MFLWQQPVFAAPIADVSAAAKVCREQLPNGTANTNFDYCAYTAPGASSPCVVSSAGSFPNFSDSCATLQLTKMVGKEPADIVAFANAGGGKTTQPAPTPASSSGGSYQNAPVTCTGGDISDPNNCPIVGRIVLAINVMSAAVGLVIIAVIVFSGIQYSSSRDDPQAVSAAKSRILNSIIALVVFIFSWTILQWLIPGGVLK